MTPWRGILAGVVVLGGAALAHAGAVEGAATIAGRAASGAVVYLEPRTPGSVPPPRVRAVMDQRNLAFAPAVLPVMRGTRIDFTNSDDVQHNVFSPSAVAGKFNLGTYGPGASRAVTLDKTGDVLILCNIHMEMEAHILVLDSPYFASVGADGRYRIVDVPAGEYVLRIWQDRWRSFSRTLEVQREEILTMDVAAGE